MQSGTRPRTGSVILTDMEYIRPRYTLVFSIAAIFILIALNVSFWFNYFSVIVWAVAASQLVRPLTDEYVGLATRLQKARAKQKKNILKHIWSELMYPTTETLTSPEQSASEKGGKGVHQTTKSVSVRARIVEFVFTNPTLFLVVAILFHLMPLQYFIETVLIFGTGIMILSMAMGYTGLIDTWLRSMSRPELVSSVIIFGIGFALVFVTVTILIAAMFEMADLAAGFSNLVSIFVEDLSQSSSHSLMHSVSADLVWLQENANMLYSYSEKEFGSRKWWIVVEALRKSFEHGDSAEAMARSGMEQMRIAYNNTDWLDLVEVAVMAAVPGHRKAMHVPSQLEGFTLSKLISGVSFSSLWLTFMEVAWRFSSLSRDLIKYLSEFAGQLVVFFFILQRLCKNHRDVITSISLFTVPASNKAKRRLTYDLQSALRNAFTDPFISAHKSALVVLIVFGVLNLPGAFISTSFVYVVGVLHIFPENGGFLACSLPWLLYQVMRIYLTRDWSFFDVSLWVDVLRALLLPMMLLKLNAFANDSRRARASKRAVSPWLTDFSIVVGISKFGADGVILGPFLAAITFVVTNFALDIAEQDAWWDDVMIAEAMTRSQSIIAKRNSSLALHQTDVPFGSDDDEPSGKNDCHHNHSPSPSRDDSISPSVPHHHNGFPIRRNSMQSANGSDAMMNMKPSPDAPLGRHPYQREPDETTEPARVPLTIKSPPSVGSSTSDQRQSQTKRTLKL